DRRGIGVHLGHERPKGGNSADRRRRARGDEQEVPACRLIRSRGCHDSYPFMLQPEEPPRSTPETRDREMPAGARVPRGGRKPPAPPPLAEQAVQNRSIGTLAIRAQARYRPVRVPCTNSAAKRGF